MKYEIVVTELSPNGGQNVAEVVIEITPEMVKDKQALEGHIRSAMYTAGSDMLTFLESGEGRL